MNVADPHDLRDSIRVAFGRLPPPLAAVAALALIEQQSHADIAEALDVPIGTVKSRIVPTLFLLVVAAVDAYQKYYFEVSNQFVIPLASRPLERALLFPMAVVPNTWGLWNMLYLRLRPRVSLGLFGALLILLLIPGGIALAAVFDTFTTQWQFALPMFPVGMAVYYLAWKYGVRFLNDEMGIG